MSEQENEKPVVTIKSEISFIGRDIRFVCCTVPIIVHAEEDSKTIVTCSVCKTRYNFKFTERYFDSEGNLLLKGKGNEQI